MRIIAGSRKGLKLAPIGVGQPELHLRPTSSKVRTSIFDILVHGQFGDSVSGARVLDLYAGTGAMGLEALSRGADFALFVDNAKIASRLIKRNVDLAQMHSSSELRRLDATSLGPNPDGPYNLVFLDPPYGLGLVELSLRSAATGGWLSDNVVIVAEEAEQVQLQEQFETVLFRKFGSTIVTFLRPSTS